MQSRKIKTDTVLNTEQKWCGFVPTLRLVHSMNTHWTQKFHLRTSPLWAAPGPYGVPHWKSPINSVQTESLNVTHTDSFVLFSHQEGSLQRWESNPTTALLRHSDLPVFLGADRIGNSGIRALQSISGSESTTRLGKVQGNQNSHFRTSPSVSQQPQPAGLFPRVNRHTRGRVGQS